MQTNCDLYKNRIGVLMGGTSTERDISLKSGSAVYAALKEKGCNAVALDLKTEREKEVVSLIKDSGISVAFIALHGRFGEDGNIQRILEKLKIPYTGSGHKASRIAMDKVLSYKIFRKHNIKIPKFIVVTKKGYKAKSINKKLGDFPLVVKPITQGSSVGISIVDNFKDLDKAIILASHFDNKIIIEEYIKGRELTVGILENKPLPVIEIISKDKFFDYKAKYQSDRTDYITSLELSDGLYEAVQQTSLKAHKVLGCEDFSRVDLILDNNYKIVVLEINSIPGFTTTSLLPKAALVSKIEFAELCLRLINLALCRKKRKK